MNKRLFITKIEIIIIVMAVAVALLPNASITGETVFDDTAKVLNKFFSPTVSSTSTTTTTSTSTAATIATCPTSNSGKPRDVWLWGSTTATDLGKRAIFFDFAASHAIRTVYIESESLISNNQAALADFITEASNRCMSVELLYGYAPWALTINHGKAVNLAGKSVIFAQGLVIKPAGIHFDVEPYLLPEWDTDQNGTANQYLTLLEKLSAETSGTGLRLTVDTPFWFDNRWVPRDGQTRLMSELVIDRVDRVVIMDYRDTSDLIIKFASSEMAYAGNTGKEVVIGVTTNCVSPTYITFCEEGIESMEQAFNSVSTAYSNSLAFRNFSVHDYTGYKALAALDTTPPAVTVSNSPASGISTATTVTISASASDANGISNIMIYVDGNLKTTCPSTITCSYASAYLAGTHTYNAAADDTVGNIGLSSTNSFSVVNPDTQSPDVAITSPSSGTTVSGIITVSASASDNIGVAGVQFKVDGTDIGAEDTTAPYSVSWNTASVLNGNHILTAVARDAAGNTATSADVTATVSNSLTQGDTQPPFVKITMPLDGAKIVDSRQKVRANATDNIGVTKVVFHIDGVLLATDTKAPYVVTWQNSKAAAGSHTIKATAYDATGNSASHQITVYK